MRVNLPRAAAATAGAAVLLLTACGGNDTGASDTSLSINTTQFATIPPVETTLAPDGSTGDGGTVTGEQTYTIQSGDYPLGVAKKFGITVDQLVSFNGWASANDFPFPGTVIRIPPTTSGGSSTGSTSAPTGSTPSQTTTTVAGGGDNSGEGTYTVASGDTLVGIAKKFDVTVDQLVAVNGWKDSNQLIYAGLVIKIPARGG